MERAATLGSRAFQLLPQRGVDVSIAPGVEQNILTGNACIHMEQVSVTVTGTKTAAVHVNIGILFGEGEVTLEGSTVFWKGQHACAALQCLGSNAQFLLHPAPYSHEYNTLLEGSALTVQRRMEHFNGLFVLGYAV